MDYNTMDHNAPDYPANHTVDHTADHTVDHKEIARSLFLEGYNCAQAVFCAFDDLTGLDRESSARLASSFGGGMGRMREVCGTVTGAFLVLGQVCGYSDPKDTRAKTDHYHLVQEFARRFRAVNGTIICRELLKNVKTKPGNDPEARTPEYYAARPCLRHVGEAAQIVDELMKDYSAAYPAKDFSK